MDAMSSTGAYEQGEPDVRGLKYKTQEISLT